MENHLECRIVDIILHRVRQYCGDIYLRDEIIVAAPHQTQLDALKNISGEASATAATMQDETSVCWLKVSMHIRAPRDKARSSLSCDPTGRITSDY